VPILGDMAAKRSLAIGRVALPWPANEYRWAGAGEYRCMGAGEYHERDGITGRMVAPEKLPFAEKPRAPPANVELWTPGPLFCARPVAPPRFQALPETLCTRACCPPASSPVREL